jgi:hypothetical protein
MGWELTWSKQFLISLIVAPVTATKRSWVKWPQKNYVGKKLKWYGKISYFYY